MKRVLSALAVVLALGGCSTIPKYEAANDIHAFLVAIRDGDRAAFDAHVDRPALKTQLHARLMQEVGQRNGDLAGFGALLAGPLVDLGVDAAVRPEVFRAIAQKYGYDPAQPIPNTLLIAQYVRPLDAERACVITKAKGPCVFVFKNEAGTWKLIGFEGHINLDKGGRVRVTE
jgi:Protein of unknown function (DUF2939)